VKGLQKEEIKDKKEGGRKVSTIQELSCRRQGVEGKKLRARRRKGEEGPCHAVLCPLISTLRGVHGGETEI